MTGRKNDKGKLRYDLIPWRPMIELARAYTAGVEKYDDRNWEKGMAWSRYVGAGFRHFWKWIAGETRDPENDVHHLAAACFCLFALMEYETTHPELDDRVKGSRREKNICRWFLRRG